MTTTDCYCIEDSIEKCDIFDFMAKYVGLSVLHPGGFESTNRLLTKCKINKNSRVLDIACGKGTTSILIAQKYKCKVIGVDICPVLISDAKEMAKKKRVESLIDFQVGDATCLPFKDDEFDATISQAMLVLIENKDKVVQEALRVLKPAGKAGWIELTWQRDPSDDFIKQVSEVICAYCMLNVRLYEEWNDLFIKSGAKNLDTAIYSMDFNGGLRGMINDEGFNNSMRIIYKYISDSKVRNRMNIMNKFFKKHEDIFGYGIYIMNKTDQLNMTKVS